MNEIRITTWDPAAHLNDPEDVAAYLQAALEEDDSQLLIVALRDIVQSEGFRQLAQANQTAGQNLYQVLDDEKNPSFRSVCELIRSLGLHLQISA